ncbi:MAG: metallophosphoesterase [Clostridia bacterium]|nr:metallophosphoesterase [Clostridia bacterium]
MKTIKITHLADLHVDGEPVKAKKCGDSFDQILYYHHTDKVDAVVIAGDLFERKQSFCQNSGLPMLIKFLRELSELVDFIFITKGNNSHDEPGSVSLLHQLEPNIYAYEYPVVLAVEDSGNVYDLLREMEPLTEPNYIISLVPYPSKAGFITETSIDNNNADFLEKFEQLFELIGDVTQPYTCPKMLAFHGNVVGSRLSTGQTLVSQDIMVAPSTLEKAKADYYALGHIHLRQMIRPNMIYAGSIYNKNWGEIERKSFTVIEFNDNENNITEWGRETNLFFLEAAKPMIKIECTYSNGETEYKPEDDLLVQQAIHNDCEVRLRITVDENERKTITDDDLMKIKLLFGEDTKIEFNIVPAQRESRSEKIMNCKSLLDEVKEYASVTSEEINGTIEKKVFELQEVF